MLGLDADGKYKVLELVSKHALVSCLLCIMLVKPFSDLAVEQSQASTHTDSAARTRWRVRSPLQARSMEVWNGCQRFSYVFLTNGFANFSRSASCSCAHQPPALYNVAAGSKLVKDVSFAAGMCDTIRCYAPPQ